MIPDFISMSDMFVVLTPRCRHAVTGTFCGFGTWTERGWCRLELWCKMLSAARLKTHRRGLLQTYPISQNVFFWC